MRICLHNGNATGKVVEVYLSTYINLIILLEMVCIHITVYK